MEFHHYSSFHFHSHSHIQFRTYTHTHTRSLAITHSLTCPLQRSDTPVRTSVREIDLAVQRDWTFYSHTLSCNGNKWKDWKEGKLGDIMKIFLNKKEGWKNIKKRSWHVKAPLQSQLANDMLVSNVWASDILVSDLFSNVKYQVMCYYLMSFKVMC